MSRLTGIPHPAVLKLRELVEEGELGRIQYIYSHRLNLGRIRREENILWSFASHDISVILGLVGEMPEVIQTQGGNYLHDRIADVTVSLLSFPSGIKAHIFVSWLHPYKEQKLVVVGDRKMVVFDDVEERDKFQLYSHTIHWKNHVPIPSRAEAQPVPFDPREPLQAECVHFLECIQTRQTPRTDGCEGLRVLTVLQRCQEALEHDTALREAVAVQPQPAYVAHASAFRLSDSTGARNGVIPSSFVDSAFTVRTGDPEPLETQGIRHGLETNSSGHRRGHWSTGAARRSMIIERCPYENA
jgi:UDP-2-acetamido-3-amino-2,3-dideoxy-glucuronate N-acetyltransferase